MNVQEILKNQKTLETCKLRGLDKLPSIDIIKLNQEINGQSLIKDMCFHISYQNQLKFAYKRND